MFSHDGKIQYAEDMGSDYVLIHNQDNFIKSIMDITNGSGCDVIFEHIGLDTWKQSMICLSRGGRLVTCGATTGAKVSYPHINL